LGQRSVQSRRNAFGEDFFRGAPFGLKKVTSPDPIHKRHQVGLRSRRLAGRRNQNQPRKGLQSARGLPEPIFRIPRLCAGRPENCVRVASEPPSSRHRRRRCAQTPGWAQVPSPGRAAQSEPISQGAPKCSRSARTKVGSPPDPGTAAGGAPGHRAGFRSRRPAGRRNQRQPLRRVPAVDLFLWPGLAAPVGAAPNRANPEPGTGYRLCFWPNSRRPVWAASTSASLARGTNGVDGWTWTRSPPGLLVAFPGFGDDVPGCTTARNALRRETDPGAGPATRQGGANRAHLARGPKVLAVCPSQFFGFGGLTTEPGKLREGCKRAPLTQAPPQVVRTPPKKENHFISRVGGGGGGPKHLAAAGGDSGRQKLDVGVKGGYQSGPAFIRGNQNFINE
jgi:hypothetical protein